MRDYKKQNKAVFLSNGRCVFEKDAPRYEAEIKRETLSSKDVPFLIESEEIKTGTCDEPFGYDGYDPFEPKSTQRKNCDTCKHDYPYGGSRFCHLAENRGVSIWIRANWDISRNVCFDGADNCPGWKGKGE